MVKQHTTLWYTNRFRNKTLREHILLEWNVLYLFQQLLAIMYCFITIQRHLLTHYTKMCIQYVFTNNAPAKFEFGYRNKNTIYNVEQVTDILKQGASG